MISIIGQPCQAIAGAFVALMHTLTITLLVKVLLPPFKCKGNKRTKLIYMGPQNSFLIPIKTSELPN